MHQDTLVVQGPSGPIVAVRNKPVLIPVRSGQEYVIPLETLCLAINLIRWGVSMAQFVFTKPLVDAERRRVLCSLVEDMCASIANPRNEKFLCNEGSELPNNKGTHSIFLKS
jgi:hypothetical protein